MDPGSERVNLSQATLVASCSTKASMQKGFDQFQGKPGSDDLSVQTKHIHVIVLDALTGGEHIVCQPGPHAGNLVCCDGCAYAAGTLTICQFPAIKGCILQFPFANRGCTARLAQM
jgi:hypothetical protein